MPKSVLEAIRSGIWDYEPVRTDENRFAPTEALPGSEEKLAILSDRLRSGLPLWHPEDRLHHGELEAE